MTKAMLLLVLASTRAAAQDAQVIDASGDLVFVGAGAADGLRRGMTVTFGDREAIVVETNAHTAALRGAVPVGATGRFDPAPPRAPRPDSAFVEQWPRAEPPAARTSPRLAAPPRIAIDLLASTYVVTGGDAQAEARVIASFDQLTQAPLGLDLDASARWYSTGANRFERTPLLVRTAQLRYGPADDPLLAVGRLRYAASSLGMLDGGRAAVHTGALELAAFGGLVPDPLSGKPTADASRFGAEVVYAANDARIAATAYGSTWLGTLDERRLSVVANAQRGGARLDGWLDAQQFPAGNPWGASAIEVTGAGASADWRRGGSHLGLDVTFLRPERSLRLAAALPADWLRTEDATTDWWLATTLSGGTRTGPWAFDGIASLGETRGRATSGDASVYLRAERDLGSCRAIAAASAGRVDFTTFEAADLGLGVNIGNLDVFAAYRPERLSDGPAPSRMVHQGVAEVRASAARQVQLAVSILGSPDALAMLATVGWRTR